MGCDIHCYIEYKNGDRWCDFGGHINPGRNYLMFSLMAGVRSGEDAPPPKFPLRGRPDDLAYAANDDAFVYISESGGEDYVTAEKAALWVKNGCSDYKSIDGKPTWVSGPDWHSHSWLTCAEYEEILRDYAPLAKSDADNSNKEAKEMVDELLASGSLKPENEATVRERFRFQYAPEPEYEAMLAAMKRLEELGFTTRLVFWFDN